MKSSLALTSILKVLYGFNDTTSSYPVERTVRQLFEEVVDKNPDMIAITGLGGTGGVSSALEYQALSYKEFDAKAEVMACVLREKNVEVDTIVGLLAERSVEMLIGMFGIIKAGGAYLPIEVQYPEARKQYMLEDSKTNLLVTTRDLYQNVEVFGNLNFETVFIEEVERRLPGVRAKYGSGHSGSESSTAAPASSSNLVYVIYTSGTTGKPKGTLTTHYNIIRVVRNTNYIEVGSEDRVMQLSNYAFDGSTFDIFGALLNGAALVLIKKEHVINVDQLAELIKKEEITAFFVTTALFTTLVDLELDCFETIRKVLFGGERVSLEHSKKALNYLGKNRVIHVYGPTETTVYATYYSIDSIDEDLGTVPIGKPISNTTLNILDAAMKPVPIGIAGEIYVGGDGLARGYLNRPELTAEKFIDNPNSSIVTHHSKLLYRTGDLARWLPDGNVEFIGRIDQQLKIRGFRIELGEVENQLLNHEKVKEVLVVDMKTEGGDIYLCAWPQFPGNQWMTSRHILRYLSAATPLRAMGWGN